MRVLSRPDWAGDSTMKRTRHTAEQIIRKLKTAEQLIAQGKTVADVCRVIEVPVQRAGCPPHQSTLNRSVLRVQGRDRVC